MKAWLESLNIQEKLFDLTYPKGKKIFVNQEMCEGVICILSGEIRVFATSSNYKEITLFTLKPQEICVLSASCVLPNLELDITLQAQKECKISLLPSQKAQKLAKENLQFSQKINEIMSKRLAQTLQTLNNIAFTPTPTKDQILFAPNTAKHYLYHSRRTSKSSRKFKRSHHKSPKRDGAKG